MATSSSAGSISTASQAIMELERQYLLQNYSRLPLVIQKGKGSYVYDLDGKRYLDLITGIGVNALGHSHPRIVKVIREQAALLMHCSNLYYHQYQGPLAKKISELSGLQRSFFCNSGTEAVEGAIKMIRSHGRRIHPEKTGIVSLENSFHGRSTGALAVTGQHKYRLDFEPLMPGVKFVERNDSAALEAAVDERTAGIVIEVIQGEGGIYPVDAAFAARARELADRYNALLVFDEIQCGVGRTGRHFAYQLFDPPVLPDVMLVAKPLACGIPLGVIAANEKAAAALTAGMHGSTFGGGAIACRVALEFFDILEELLPAIHHVGGYFRMRLEDLGAHYRYIKEVRGYGLMIGVELRIPGKPLVTGAIEHGLLINCTHENVLRFLPPYTITEQEVDKAIAALKKVFDKGREYYIETTPTAQDYESAKRH